MTRPINIYSITRISDEKIFNIIESHQSQKKFETKVQSHEIESLRILVDNLIFAGVNVHTLDNFFFGFAIPQIGKEFDLLKFTDKLCLNIELKSEPVPEEQILNQLLKNRHYLKHLGKKITLFSVVTKTMTCYKLTYSDELEKVDFCNIATEIVEHNENSLDHIDDLFKVSEYLVSPLNTPEKFIQGEYFLTNAQEQIKKSILKDAEKTKENAFFHITGKPGTGKTLLLYDIAKTLSKNGNTVIIHCGKMSDGQSKISEEISNLKVVPVIEMRADDFKLSDYAFILVDESHRIYTSQFHIICKEAIKNGQVCIFSSDPGQVLSSAEEKNNIVEKIKHLDMLREYELSEKIRMNQELHSFILQVKCLNHRPQKQMDYPNVDINYANTTSEAKSLIDYYRNKGFVFINYSKSNHRYSPYEQYNEDFDTHHVIGQEFDKVVMLMDQSFYYDESNVLRGVPHPNPDYLYPNLFYQGITRVREKLALIIVNAPELMSKIASIVEKETNKKTNDKP